MMRRTSAYLEESYIEEIKLRRINFSALVNELLCEYLKGKKPTKEQLKIDIREAENEVTLAESRFKFLQKQLYDLEESEKKVIVQKVLEKRDKWE